MIIEYSNEVKGRVYAYRFDDYEKQAIARGLKGEVKKLEKKIQKVENDPDNEGQVTYQCQIEELCRELNDLREIIKEFS
jgi:phage host-nuclease inhibitor protein Gam